MRARPVDVALFVALACAPACGRAAPEATPEGAVHLWLERMEASTDDPRVTREAYELLGPAARANLEERARRTGLLTGKRVEPSEMLAAGRFGLKFRPKSMKASVVGDRATVDVVGAEPAEHASVRCVRTSEGWRLEPELPEPIVMPKRDGG